MPVLGPLFRSVRYQRGETELIVMVTANLVEPLNADSDSMALPGDTYQPPNDWELFIDGRMESKTPILAPPEAERFRELGLNRLQGPGAWETHGQAPAVSYGQRPDPQTTDKK